MLKAPESCLPSFWVFLSVNNSVCLGYLYCDWDFLCGLSINAYLNWLIILTIGLNFDE